LMSGEVAKALLDIRAKVSQICAQIGRAQEVIITNMNTWLTLCPVVFMLQ